MPLMPIIYVSFTIKKNLEPYKKRGIQLLNLRNLTRQQESISGVSAQTKLQFQSVLDQIFPEYRGVFGDLYSKFLTDTINFQHRNQF